MALNRIEQNTGTFISFWAVTLFLVYLIISLMGFDNEMTFFYQLGIIILFSMGLCILVFRNYRKAGDAMMIDYLNIGTQRYILAIFMVLYGIDKILGNFFDYELFALDSKLGEVPEFQLAWFFYGKNPWQELFAGIMEFVPGLFLLSRRYYYVAAIILLPVTAQVLLLNLFFKIGGITFPAALILLSCNVYIIYSQKEKIIQFFRSLNFTLLNHPLSRYTNIIIKILKGAGISLVCLIIFLKVKSTFFMSPAQKKYQSLVGVYTLKEMKRNNIDYKPAVDSLYYKDLYIEKQDRWNVLRRYNGKIDAFILKINAHNDTVKLYINKGGIGDDPDIIDSATALKGIYNTKGNFLIIKGVQLKDTLQLKYEKQDRIKAKKWFW